jgi:hypothetical protein
MSKKQETHLGCVLSAFQSRAFSSHTVVATITMTITDYCLDET